MKTTLVVTLGLGLSGIMLVQNALAERYTFVGHRAQGMGGAGAATVSDSSAQWQNPAAFGFFNREPDSVQGPVTNAVTNVVNEISMEEAPASTNDVKTAEGAVSTNAVAEASGTNDVTSSATVAKVPVTNQTYDVSYQITMADVTPERARVDNGNLTENDWGWNLLGVGVGYTMTDDMPDYVTQVGRIDYDAFGSDGLDGTPEGVESMILLSSSLYGLGTNPDSAFYVDATAGMNFRFGRVGVGVRTFGEVAGYIDNLDMENLGLDTDVAGLIADINGAAAIDNFDASTWTYTSIAQGDLVDFAGVSGGGDAEKYIDYQVTQLKNEGVMNDQHIDGAVELFNNFDYDVPTTATNSYENNLSTVTARGFGLFEVPVSYGHAFNDNLSIGVTVKGMYGTVTGTKIQATNEDSLDAALDHLEENTEASFNFGLDLGVLYRMKMLQFACVAHNINAPKFDGFTSEIQVEDGDGNPVGDPIDIHVPDYTIDPQVTLGMAFIPSKRFMLEMSYDVLETGTLLDNYNIQRISFGGELDVWLLALRLGAYNNLAAEWQDWVATAGVGVNLWAVRLDVGGAYSIGENAEYEGTEIPEEARLYAALSMEF